jgi:hypothetical protein
VKLQKPKAKKTPQIPWENISIMKNWINTLSRSLFYRHGLVVLGFGFISLLFYYPVLSGKVLLQSDIRQYEGMSRQLKEYRKETAKETFWIDNAFGGMPTYQLGAEYPGDFLSPIYHFFRLLPRPAHILFLYLFGAYLLLLILNLPWHTALFGSLAFGFSTYLLIILQVGHNTKALAVSFFPFVIGGMLLLFRYRFFWGFLLTTLSLGMQIRANHYQMTYYLLFFMGILSLVWAIEALKKKELKFYLQSVVILVFSGILALGFNATPLLATAEYTKFSTRGPSELMLDPEGAPKEQTEGLTYAYITEYSYGIFESLNLIAPRIQGGGSSEDLGEDHGVYDFLIANGVRPAQAKQFTANIPTYWGAQPILEAPAYIGVSVFFFALLALVYLRSPIRNALLVAALFSLALSWGKNFSLLTDFFIDYIPLFNKFRAVSSIQVLLELCFPVLAALGLHWALQKEAHFDFKKFVKVVGVPILFLVALLLFQGSFSFSGPNDAYFNEIYGADFMSVIREARRSIFREDVIRALLFITVLAVLIAYYQFKKGNQKFILIASIGIVLFDLLGVSSRYLSRAAFVEPARAAIPFQLTEADRVVLQDSSRYRVFEPQLGLTGARTAYFHNTLGGYHGAKPRRFEELYNYYSTHQIAGILDFLNIKYFLVPDSETNTLQALVNPNALGPAWTIANLKTAPTADDLLESLKTTDFSNEAVVLAGTFPTDLAMSYSKDTLATLTITESKPDSLVYEIETGAKQFVVFSEMYYPHGWTASVNGVNTPIVNVNYVLRGLEVPEGKSRIVFHFEPEVVRLGTQLRWTTLILFIVFLGGLYYFQKRNQNQAN